MKTLEVFSSANGLLRVLEIIPPVSTTLFVSFTYPSLTQCFIETNKSPFSATYGYAKQYSGVNLGSFVKHITSSNLSPEGLRNVSSAVMQLAAVEGLDAHKRAVSIRMDVINKF